MHPLVTLAALLFLAVICALVWAIRKLETRLAALEQSAPIGRGIRAVPVAEELEAYAYTFDGELPRVFRTHVPPEPLPAAAHLGSRLDVSH